MNQSRIMVNLTEPNVEAKKATKKVLYSQTININIKPGLS